MKTEMPKEHQLICKGCGKLLDMRDPSIFSHGWIENGEIVCYEEKEIEFSSSRKIDSPVAYMKGTYPVNIN
jgi:hypothetical protein